MTVPASPLPVGPAGPQPPDYVQLVAVNAAFQLGVRHQRARAPGASRCPLSRGGGGHARQPRSCTTISGPCCADSAGRSRRSPACGARSPYGRTTRRRISTWAWRCCRRATSRRAGTNTSGDGACRATTRSAAVMTAPQWRGEPGRGRTVLVHSEQGAGDTLQFCRLAPFAARRGLRVHVAVPDTMVRLLQCLPGLEGVTNWADAPTSCDLHCPMLSLPWALGIRAATIPSAPAYLYPDPGAGRAVAVGGWPGCKGACVSVWSGPAASFRPSTTAAPWRPSVLAALSRFKHVRWFSLQKGGAAGASLAAPRRSHGGVARFRRHRGADLQSRPGAIGGHLGRPSRGGAGQAGLAAGPLRPLLALARRAGRDSPWYPTMRIYRQPRPGDWDTVLAAVMRDLGGLGAA